MRIILPLLITLSLVTYASAQQVGIDQRFNPVDKGYGKLNLEDSYGDDDVEQIVIQPDGKVLVSGFYYSFNDTVRSCIARLNADGSLDKTFRVYGYDVDFGDGINVLKLLPDGKILLGALAYSAEYLDNNKHLLRLNGDGSVDSAFHQPDRSQMPYLLWDIAVQADGKIIVAGESDGNDQRDGSSLLRLNINGSVDTAFHSVIVIPNVVGTRVAINTIALTSAGKLIAGGNFFLAGDNSYRRQYLVQLNSNGTLSDDFTADTSVHDEIYKLALQNDKKIVFAGGSHTIGGIAPNPLGRLNADGSKDNTFNTGTGPNVAVKAITALADGRLLIGGNFNSYNGIYAKGVARLNANGTLDDSFSAGSGVSYNTPFLNCYVRTISVDTNGSYFIGGQFNVYNHVSEGGLVKVNANGSVDYAFNPAGANGAEGSVYDLVQQKNNKLVIAGDFTQYTWR